MSMKGAVVGVQVQEALRGLLDQAVVPRMARAMEPSTQHLTMPDFVRGASWTRVRTLPLPQSCSWMLFFMMSIFGLTWWGLFEKQKRPSVKFAAACMPLCVHPRGGVLAVTPLTYTVRSGH